MSENRTDRMLRDTPQRQTEICLSLLDSVGGVIAAELESGDLIFMNPAARTMLGLEKGTPMPSNLTGLTGEEYDPDLIPEQGVYTLVRPDGSGVDISSRMNTKELSDGTKLLIITLTDTTAERRLDERRRANERMTTDLIHALTRAVEAKDRYTVGHSYRVAEYSVLLAQALGWSKERQTQLRYEGLIHDLGKIGVPDSVLNKADRLTDTEYKIIQSHTTLGYYMLRDIDAAESVLSAVHYHHERYDGRGYPEGLKGKEIPENARVIGIADAFDAMNSNRIYRKAMQKEAIRRQLEGGRGTQFDPELLDVFLQLFDADALELEEPEHENETEVSRSEEEFVEEIRDFFQMFELKKEFTGEWDERVKDNSILYSCADSLSRRHNTEFNLIVTTIRAKPGHNIDPQEQEKAMETMCSVMESVTRRTDVCARISRTQIGSVLMVTGNETLGEIVQNIFSYFYKIFEARQLDISYEVINPRK